MDKSTNLGTIAALKETWANLSSTQKMVVAGMVTISIVIVTIVSMIGTRPSMSTLFSNLQSADAAAICDRLRDLKVPYEISDDGTLIKVPSNQVYDLRLKMTTQGLPAGGTVGFEIFDKQSFGTSEFGQKVDYQRALQGELERTISQLAQVESARVHLVCPEERLYSDKQNDPTASIQLRLRRGVSLGDDQVAGVVHLVASSVEGLKPENVTVVDTEGNVLAEANGDGSGLATRMSATQVKLKRDYERQLEKDIQTMLDNVVGSGKSVVRVSAKMNFDHKEITKEEVTPGGSNGKGILVSEESVNETYSGSAKRHGGVVGAAKTKATTQITGSNGDYVHNEINNKYEVTRSTERTAQAPGQIEKLSVAVMLDKSVGGDKVSAIRDTVKAAVGIDESKGDQIVVSSVAFDHSEEKKAQEDTAGAAKSNMITTIAKDAAAVVLLVVFMMFIRGLFKSVKVAPGSPAAARKVSMETAESVITQAFEQAGVPQAPAPAATGPESYVQDVAKNSPDEVANVVRAWMQQ